ncbi:hypothetical protein [Alteromonas sp. BMJM2]|uniref:hypothetical protein n=1 Tax=Alteromonas sp. BMJM2 TaxID=2954241 RepID=UPI0022B5888E|nr:hypothetical protein [Alteromonas sp. BMJM2]
MLKLSKIRNVKMENFVFCALTVAMASIGALAHVERNNSNQTFSESKNETIADGIGICPYFPFCEPGPNTEPKPQPKPTKKSDNGKSSRSAA